MTSATSVKMTCASVQQRTCPHACSAEIVAITTLEAHRNVSLSALKEPSMIKILRNVLSATLTAKNARMRPSTLVDLAPTKAMKS